MEVTLNNRLARIFAHFVITHEVNSSRPSEDGADVLIYPDGHEVKGRFEFDKSEDCFSAGFVQWTIRNKAEKKIFEKILEEMPPVIGITERVISGNKFITYLTHYYLSSLTDTEVEFRFLDTIGRASEYNLLLRQHLSKNGIT